MKESASSFIKRLSQFSLGPIISAVISFFSVPITTYFVEPKELGMASMYTMVFTLISLLVYFGMDNAFVREFNGVERKESLLYNSIIFPIIISVILGLIFIINARWISILMFERKEIKIVIILALSFPFSIIDRFNMLLLRMQEKAKLYSILNIINKVINIVLLIIYLKYIEGNFRGIVVSNFLVLIIMSGIQMYINKKYWKKFSIKLFDIEIIKRMLVFGLPLVPNAILTWLFDSMDRIAMRTYSNFDQIGMYSAGFKIVMVLGIIQQSFSTFWVPTAYRWHEEGIDKKMFEKVSYVLMTIMSFIFFGIVIFKDIIIRLLDSKYCEAAVVIPFLLFYPLMYTISETTTLGIPFSRKTYYNIWISLLCLLVNFIGNLYLVPHYGALGASVSTGIAYIVFFWTRTIISRKLWYKFDLNFYFHNTVILVLLSSIDIIFNNVLYDLMIFIVLAFINKKIVIEIFKYLKCSLIKKNG